MPGLVNRPDLDQLRRQARELLRAAASGEPTAVARIRAVSERMTLSAAQLALAREHGYRNWTALRVEVERRRSPLNRWSFGGATGIETLAGRLLAEGLVASDDGAVLYTSLPPWQHDARPDREALARRGRTEDEASQAFDEEIQAGREVGSRRSHEPGRARTNPRRPEISAEDDLGCSYLCRLGDGSGGNGYEELRLQFRPRLDPLARRLRLTCTGSSEQITIDLDLALLARSPG